MTFDVSTLTAATAFVALIAGGLLVVIGRHYRQGPAAMLWGISLLLGAVTITLMVENVDLKLVLFVGLLGAAIGWLSMRQFHGREFPALWLIAAGIAWVGAGVLLSERGASLVGQLLSAAFIAAGAAELWRGRSERLGARLPLMFILAGYALVLVAGAGIASVMAVEISFDVPAFAWVFGLQTIANAILTTVLIILLIKERSAASAQAAAEIDQVTGLLTRGRFMAKAVAALETATARGVPFTVVIFDLDHFKRINDTFGHRTGDAVLERFGSLLLRGLRRGDVAGRIGGEEFAMVMPGAGSEAAMALVERIRAAFAEEAKWVDGQGVKATLSAGVAVAEPRATLDDVIEAADRALYSAKARGRNRVQLQTGVEPVDAVVVRIA